MKEFFKQWQAQSPKSFEKFKNAVYENLLLVYRESGEFEIATDKYFLTFEMLTGVIEKFFSENKIDYTISPSDNLKYMAFIYFDGKCVDNTIPPHSDKNIIEKIVILRITSGLENILNKKETNND